MQNNNYIVLCYIVLTVLDSVSLTGPKQGKMTPGDRLKIGTLPHSLNKYLSPCEQSEKGGSQFNWKKKSFLVGNNYQGFPHLRGVWNLPHKFHLYLIFGKLKSDFTIIMKILIKMTPLLKMTPCAVAHT